MGPANTREQNILRWIADGSPLGKIASFFVTTISQCSVCLGRQAMLTWVSLWVRVERKAPRENTLSRVSTNWNTSTLLALWSAMAYVVRTGLLWRCQLSRSVSSCRAVRREFRTVWQSSRHYANKPRKGKLASCMRTGCVIQSIPVPLCADLLLCLMYYWKDLKISTLRDHQRRGRRIRKVRPSLSVHSVRTYMPFSLLI